MTRFAIACCRKTARRLALAALLAAPCVGSANTDAAAPDSFEAAAHAAGAGSIRAGLADRQGKGDGVERRDDMAGMGFDRSEAVSNGVPPGAVSVVGVVPEPQTQALLLGGLAID